MKKPAGSEVRSRRGLIRVVFVCPYAADASAGAKPSPAQPHGAAIRVDAAAQGAGVRGRPHVVMILVVGIHL